MVMKKREGEREYTLSSHAGPMQHAQEISEAGVRRLALVCALHSVRLPSVTQTHGNADHVCLLASGCDIDRETQELAVTRTALYMNQIEALWQLRSVVCKLCVSAVGICMGFKMFHF